MRRCLPLVLLLVGCPPAADDDDSAPRVVIVDDDDDSTDPLPEGTPVAVPGAFTASCAEVEPNDAPVFAGTTNTADPPWDDATDCGSIGGSGAVLGITGRVDRLVQDSWDGDTDAFRFAVEEAMTPAVTVQWDPLQGDYDARLWCAAGTSWLDRADGGLATSSQPEHVDATLEIAAGSTCYLFITGFSGPVSDYVAWLQID